MALNTGWKQWDKNLSRLVGKKIKCLEIGSYRGDGTCWMLKNLCTNNESLVYSVDTWEGSPEYGNGDFNKVERDFDENVAKTGKTHQNIKMKMYSHEALMELNKKQIFFDFIYIDASHEAKDVLQDAVLSWNILNEKGIMIFDDYLWDKLNKDYYCPKIAIDSFMHIFHPQITLLYKGYQVIIEKKLKKDFEQPKLAEYYELLEDLQKIPVCQNTHFYDDTIPTLSYNILIDTKKPKYTNGEAFEKIMEKDNNRDNDEFYNYDLNRLLLYIEDINIIYNSLSENIIKDIKKYDFDPYNDMQKISNNMAKNIENPTLETISQISSTNDLIKKDISMIIFSHTTNHNNDIIISFSKKKLNLDNITFHDFPAYDKNLYTYNDIKTLSDSLNGKIDIIITSLISKKFLSNIKRIDYEKYYTIQFLNCVLFGLISQSLEGIFVTTIFTMMTKATLDIITIIKKYYKKVYFFCCDAYSKKTTMTKIIATGFFGINEQEIEELKNNVLKIYDKIPEYDNYEKPHFITNILNNNNNVFLNNIKIYIVEKTAMIVKINTVWRKMIDYIKKNNHKKQKIKNYIYTLQLHIFFNWINTYNII